MMEFEEKEKNKLEKSRNHGYKTNFCCWRNEMCVCG